jgi:ketosteroid isomerase-like protein
VTRRLRIQRAFVFQKAADGWRCREDELAPVDSGVASGP